MWLSCTQEPDEPAELCSLLLHSAGSLLQDVSSGKPVRVGDTNLYGMEIDVAAAADEIRSIGKADKGKSVDDVLGSFGLGVFAEQLKDLKLSMLCHLLSSQLVCMSEGNLLKDGCADLACNHYASAVRTQGSIRCIHTTSVPKTFVA